MDLAVLSENLDGGAVKTRKQGGRTVSYIEGFHVIAELNEVFGHVAWDRATTMLKCVAETERPLKSGGRGWGVSYIAQVTLTIYGQDEAGKSFTLSRTGTGSGHGIDRDLGLAHESAVKEAETDAMKRAAMTLGWRFGLALYDKQAQHVTNGGDVHPPEDPHANAEDYAPEYISPEMVIEINRAIEASGIDRTKFLAWAQAGTVREILRSNFGKVIAVLNQKIAEKG